MTTNEQQAWSTLPVSPGSVLKEEIDYRGISHRQLSNMMGCSQSLIDKIIDEQTPVTTEIAQEIENTLGINAHIWLNLEAGFRATIAHNELVAREGPIHTCDLGENCPTQQVYEDEEEESEISAGMLMDEGE